MTQGVIFNHVFAKTHFGAFPVFRTKYMVILEDKNGASEKNFDTRN